MVKLVKKYYFYYWWGIMPFTDKELHPSITLGQENNRFPLFFEPQILLREASPQVNGSVPQGQKKLIDCYHLKPSSDYWWTVCMCSHQGSKQCMYVWNYVEGVKRNLNSFNCYSCYSCQKGQSMSKGPKVEITFDPFDMHSIGMVGKV